MTWLSSTSAPSREGGPADRSDGPPRVPLCGSATISTLLSSTDSVISRPSEATNRAAIPAWSTSGDGTSTLKPWTARPPPLANVTLASKDARYSFIRTPRFSGQPHPRRERGHLLELPVQVRRRRGHDHPGHPLPGQILGVRRGH